MSKHLAKESLYKLPSGNSVHPCRLIVRDGTLMWKHALLYQNTLNIPATEAIEAHIVKTAQRLEELNSWIANCEEPWETLVPQAWYVPEVPYLNEGISLFFKHSILNAEDVYSVIKDHTQEFETLKLLDDNGSNYLYFQRC